MAKGKDKEQGVLVGHFMCDINPDCDSSDALSVYSHKDGSTSCYCWSCGHSKKNYALDGKEPVLSVREKTPEQLAQELEMFETVRDDFSAMSMKDRRIKAEVYDFFGIKMDTESDGETVRAVYYPTYRNGEHVGYRTRSRIEPWERAAKKDPDRIGVLKSFKGGLLDTKKGIEMCGQHLFPAGGNMLIIAMGEEDMVAAYHMTSLHTKFEGGYPTISPPSGENMAFVRDNYDYIKSFERIVIIPDPDKAGEKFKNDLCKLLPIGKTFIANMPNGYKDPSELWSKNSSTAERRNKVSKAFYNLMWKCERYSPAGIKAMSEGWGDYEKRGSDTLIPFPESFGELNTKTHGGYALGEITTITAPSSVGKSIFIKEMLYTALEKSPYKIGVISLEETLDEFIEGFLSIHMSTQLNEIPFDMRNRSDEWAEFNSLLKIGSTDGEDRVFFLDHQGACDGEELLDKADFLINGLGCQIIVLDPATLAVSGMNTNEDEFCSEVLKRVKRGNKVAWLNVCHVRKNSAGSTANSEGADISEEMMKGSGSWFQVSMNNLILTRNKVHACPIIRNTTTLKLSKCRRHGKNTGMAGWVYYNGDNGRLEKGQNPAELEELQFDDCDEMGYEGIPDKPLSNFGSGERRGGKKNSGDEWA